MKRALHCRRSWWPVCCCLIAGALFSVIGTAGQAQEGNFDAAKRDIPSKTPLFQAGQRLRDRVLRDRPERRNYRYELALEGVLSFAQATADHDTVDELLNVARQLGVDPEAKISWQSQPFGCLTWALYEASQDERWLIVFREQSDDLLQNVWRGPDGELLHPRGEHRGGGNAMLIDAMQEYVARMARMAAVTDEARGAYYDEIVQQCQTYRATLRNPTSGLWSQGRGWLQESPDQLSPGAWSRGHGWLLQGFSRALEVLPEETEARQVVLTNFQEICASLLPLQQPDGSWHTLLHRAPSESPIDISGTAMIATAMSQGVRHGWLKDPAYQTAAEKAFDLLPKYVTDDGTVLSVSPGPGPLQSEEDYLTQEFPADNDHGIFAVLFAAAEQQRMLQVRPGLVASGKSSQAKNSQTVQQPIPQNVIDKFSLSDFYQKCILIEGFPVVASVKVNDAALQEAAHVVRSMLAKRSDILQRLAANRIRLAVMAVSERTCDIPEHSDLTPPDYWNRRARGLGATRHRPCVSCAEENVLNLAGDPYHKECILIHEFAHAIHLMALVEIDPKFQEKLDACYAAAQKSDTWKDTYAGSNVNEYWAEGVQSWFDCNTENDSQHNHVNTREELKQHDPQLYALIQSVFVDQSYRYVRSDSAERKDDHLQGLDRTKLGSFKWGSADDKK